MPILRITALAAATIVATPASAQWNAVAYVDSQGRSWRQLSFSCGASWNQVASMCPSDGATPCAGVLNGHPIDGWVWATRAQVEALLVELGAAVDPANCTTGPTADGGVFQWFHNTLSPENGYFIEGWTANATAILGLPGHAFAPSVRLDLDVMLAMTCVATSHPRSQADARRGVWLFRHPCAARHQHQRHDRQHIGRHQEQLIGHAWNDRLQAQLKAVKQREEERAEERLSRFPGCEDHQRDTDPATALHHRGEETVKGRHGQKRPAHRHQG